MENSISLNNNLSSERITKKISQYKENLKILQRYLLNLKERLSIYVQKKQELQREIQKYQSEADRLGEEVKIKNCKKNSSDECEMLKYLRGESYVNLDVSEHSLRQVNSIIGKNRKEIQHKCESIKNMYNKLTNYLPLNNDKSIAIDNACTQLEHDTVKICGEVGMEFNEDAV